MYGIVTDNTAVMGAVKYVWNQFKFFGGYEYIVQVNPANPLGVGATAQGGYQLSGVEDNNLNSPKIVQIFWTGARYAYDAKTDITLSYYHQLQNTFYMATSFGGGCPVANYRSSCSGTLDEVSLYADHHFTKRFDVYAGFAYSQSHQRPVRRHSSRLPPAQRQWRPLLLRQQLGSDDWRSLHLLIVFAGRRSAPFRCEIQVPRASARGIFLVLRQGPNSSPRRRDRRTA